MKLADASSYFDRTPVTDPNSGTLLFKCQIDPFSDSVRDSANSYRRTMSVRPGTAMPTSRVVQALGQVWIIGAMEPDGWENLHREKYVLQHAPLIASVSRLSDFLAGTVQYTARASAHWVKDSKQLEVSSETPSLCDVSMSSIEDLRVHDVVWGLGYAYLVLAPRQMASGILTANSLELDQILPLPATLMAKTYSPSSGAYTSSAPVGVNALKVRWQSLFQYGSQMSERYQEGDVTIALPGGTAVTTSTQVELDGVKYQVLAVLSVSGAIALHARVV